MKPKCPGHVNQQSEEGTGMFGRLASNLRAATSCKPLFWTACTLVMGALTGGGFLWGFAQSAESAASAAQHATQENASRLDRLDDRVSDMRDQSIETREAVERLRVDLKQDMRTLVELLRDRR
jgi:hypothetical protein